MNAYCKGESFPSAPSVQALRARLGGREFVEGAYRIHSDESAVLILSVCERAFPKYAGRWEVFAYDWLGRQFVVDSGRRGLVSIVDPGFAEVLETPVSLDAFHDDELRDHPDDAVMLGYLRRWKAAGGIAPNPSQCVGFKRPAYLGGRDEMDNLELSDMELYLELFAQMWEQVRDLPPGTRVNFTFG